MEIIIMSKTFKDYTAIYIDDNGKESINIENISFERFESSKSGIGIGLHLCRQIIEAHLGDLIVTKNSCGGLRFILKIPNKYCVLYYVIFITSCNLFSYFLLSLLIFLHDINTF